MIESDSVRFWSKVDRSGGPDACWPFMGSRNEKGYGLFNQNGTKRAHRVAWELTNGPVPNGLNVLHHCDNPPCCNLRHLWPGTVADNQRDMMRKGRSTRAERCKRGHLLEGNCYWTRTRHRICRPCALARSRAWRKHRRAA